MLFLQLHKSIHELQKLSHPLSALLHGHPPLGNVAGALVHLAEQPHGVVLLGNQHGEGDLQELQGVHEALAPLLEPVHVVVADAVEAAQVAGNLFLQPLQLHHLDLEGRHPGRVAGGVGGGHHARVPA